MAIQDGIEREEIVHEIVERWENWKQARREKEDIWQECLTNYLVHIDESRFENWPWRSKVADTFSQEQADTIASSLRNAWFPVNEEFFEVKGDDDAGKSGEATFQAYMESLIHDMKFIERLNPFAKQLAVIGNAPILLTWETMDLSRRKRIEEVDLATGERSYRVVDETKKAYEGPGIEVLDAFDVVFDPAAKHPRQTPFLRRVMVPKDLLAGLYPDLTDGEIEDACRLDTSIEQSDRFKIQRATVFGFVAPETKDATATVEQDDLVEVIELYGDLVCDGTRYKDMVGAVINRKTLAKFQRNPYWGGRQIVWGTYDQLWFTMLGKGPLEPVRGTQELIDTFCNQKVDILNVITNGCFAYVDDGIIDPSTLYLSPRAGIEVGNIANIKELHPNTNISLTYQEIEMLRARGERSTGKSRFDMGQAPGGRRTAFEASMIGQGGGARSQDITKHIANDVLEYILGWMVVTVQQMKWDSGEIPNEVLLGEYHVNYLGADLTAMRQFEIQQAQLFMDMIGRYPVLGEATNIPVLVNEIAKLFHFRNREIAKPIKQYLAEQQKKQALIEQQAMTQQDAMPAGMPMEGGMNEAAAQ